MGLFDSLFGDPRGAARRAQGTIDNLTSSGRARIEGAADVVEQRANVAAGEQRAIAEAFRALGDQPTALERQATAQGARARTQGAARQAALSGGPLNANRLQMSELEATSMAQALLAERSQRIQRQISLNQAVGQQLLQAGQLSRAGAAARLESLSAFENAALQAQSQMAMARAQAESGPSPLGKALAFAGQAAATYFGGPAAGAAVGGATSGGRNQQTQFFGM